MNKAFWDGKRVFLTGHTGFKGGWLSLLLNRLGAEVYGYALNPPTDPSFFTVAKVSKILSLNKIADIRNADTLESTMVAARPDIVLHLAAQPLVRFSYANPIETYSTNVMGTVNLFEAIRKTPSVRAVINVTTDKCYENREWVWPYRENEAMGGYDPYSSSKGCSELITAAYRRSFFDKLDVALASARAGNVIGGGDWAEDRLIPDFLKSIDDNDVLTIRAPNAIRPWQHVLEPLAGYLLLAENLYTHGKRYAEAWNFGPPDTDAQSVTWIVEQLVTHFPNTKWQITEEEQLHEAHLLKLDSNKSKKLLNWQSQWNLITALSKICEWHQAWHNQLDMHQFSLSQIADYQHSINV